MSKENKAHTATANRIAARYGATYNNDADAPDIQTDELTIEVETTATLAAGIRRLKSIAGPVFVALTNREGLTDALRRTGGARVGVMDPHGNIVKQSDPPYGP